MRLRIVVAALLLTAGFATTSTAKQEEGGDGQTRSDWFTQTEIEYLDAYEKAYKAGHYVGRNIVDDGLDDGGEPSQARVEESTARMNAWLNPPAAPAPVPAEETGYTEEETAYTGGAPLEAIAACESGGDPGAISPDGTYRGAYQFDYPTWQSVGGSGDPAAASMEEQTMRAGMLYEQSGSSPWPVCGQ